MHKALLLCFCVTTAFFLALLPRIRVDGFSCLTRGRSMSWRSHGVDNNDLVNTLHKNGILTSSRAMEAMKQIDRADYVVDRQGAYEDRPQPLGFSATISAPHMHGYCLSLLEEHLQPGMKVLDVGSGSGYLTAVMALMVGESGRAIGVEHIPELVERAKRSVQQGPAAHLMEKGQLSFHATDGRLGYPEEAPFDAIHVGAAAPDLPQKLVEQLKVGGRLVCPVGTYSQELEIVDKRAGGAILRRSAMSVQYVPLTDRKEHAAVL
eukprot:TRINITY_DN567_c0_g1_i1.p1 TRINITY_DN567_c0_g1~~TRINITY_DN567_c0_g1_i1.p1  ORF type:complete len:264 (-),score=49.82 TRINITY_DN567_c0_g1_i1:852-1643(-)